MNEIVPAPEGERSYFSAIEAAFIARRGTPFLLSPRDFAIMRSWHDLSIPLEDVLAGIDEAFDRRAERGSLSRINSLSYCEGAVLEAWERRSSARAGRSAKAPESPVETSRALEELRASLESLAAEDPRIAESARSACRTIEKGSSRERDASAWEEKLRRVEKRFLSEVEAILTEAERSEMESTITRSIAGETERMSPEALRRTLGVLRRRWLRNRFQTPTFSLLA